MKFRTFLLINSVVAIPTGIACALLPAQLLANYGVLLSPMGLVIYQFWGVTIFGLGLITWFARKSTETGVQKGLALSLFVIYVLSCAVAIKGQFAGANSFGWTTVGLFFLLASSFGYLRFIKLSTQSKPARLEDRGI